MEQANSGNVLLYTDVHGIRSSEDIGILTKAEILDDGNWYTEYRLYDESDGVDSRSVDIAAKVWKQLRGDPPYKTPLQKGFSVEGYIPEGGILSAEKSADGSTSRRIIDEVLLDGVVLVPRPAYQDSIASAVYKALGEMSPAKEEHIKKSIQSTFSQALNGQEIENQFFKTRYLLGDALEESVQKVMRRKGDDTVRDQLDLVFKEYSGLMIASILKSQDLFNEQDKEEEVKKEENPYKNEVVACKTSHGEVEKAICSLVRKASRNKVMKSPSEGVVKALISEIKSSKSKIKKQEGSNESGT
jgi:hypothetical protein